MTPASVESLRGGSSLNLDVNSRRQRQLVKRVNRLAGGLTNIYEPLMRPDLELLSRLLIDVRASQDRVSLHSRGQRNWSMHNRSSSLRSIYDICS